VYACTIGMRPDARPNPNGSRGVTLDPPSSDVQLTSNRMSANVRSGVFIAGGEHVALFGNTIGRRATESRDLGNGASGVFAGPAAKDVLLSGNFIGGNHHMGIAVAREARGVRVANTWIDPNGGLPLDHGLDDFDGTVRMPGFALPAPNVEYATYDTVTKKTTIHGTFDSPDPAAQWRLTIYGAIGAWPEMGLPSFTFSGTSFTVTIDGRPQTIHASVGPNAASDWSTSEFSRTVQVVTFGKKLLSTVLRRP